MPTEGAKEAIFSHKKRMKPETTKFIDPLGLKHYIYTYTCKKNNKKTQSNTRQQTQRQYILMNVCRVRIEAVALHIGFYSFTSKCILVHLFTIQEGKKTDIIRSRESIVFIVCFIAHVYYCIESFLKASWSGKHNGVSAPGL